MDLYEMFMSVLFLVSVFYHYDHYYHCFYKGDD